MKNEKNNERVKVWKSANSKALSKPRKRETKSVKTVSAAISGYSRQDIESILTTVMLTAVSLAAFLLTLTFFIAVLKH